MVRQKALYIEFALIAAAQAVGLISAVLAVVPATAQVTPPREVSNLPEAALNDPNIVQDFMAAVPPSDPIPRTYSWRSPLTGQIVSGNRPEQDAYFHRRIDVTAHRFLTNKWRGGGAMRSILRDAASGFARECAAKGSRLEPHDTALYVQTLSENRPRLSDFQFEICMAVTDRALGALLIVSNRASFRDRDSHAVITYHPRVVVTQAVLDRRNAEAAVAQQQQASERERAAEQERIEVDQWRRTIRPGTETGCGPVLRVNGDLIEVAHYQTRAPRWYRRIELWPTLFTKGGLRTCS